MKRLEIGRLGSFNIIPGFYAYVGSAFGPGGLRARIRHHLESVAQPHWHIDYLLGYAEPVEVWYALAGRKLEQNLAELMLALWSGSIKSGGGSQRTIKPAHESRETNRFFCSTGSGFQFHDSTWAAAQVGECAALVRASWFE